MVYEVENKFHVVDLSGLERQLSEKSVAIGPESEQIDTYFAHPSRDYAATDEAVRIRCVGEENFLTYKGPKIDTTTKTRREIELPIATGQSGATQWTSMLEALGFRAVAEVRKRRRPLTIPWEGETIHGALDVVDRLGTFIELEIISDAEHLSEARRHLSEVADWLNLSAPERRSYLELLQSLEAHHPPGSE